MVSTLSEQTKKQTKSRLRDIETGKQVGRKIKRHGYKQMHRQTYKWEHTQTGKQKIKKRFFVLLLLN